MDPFYTVNEVSPSIYHIHEPAGVCSTLIVGSRSALLIDTGYGFADLSAIVRSLTDLPVQLVNTHGHLDHAGGNYLFGQSAWIHPYEHQVYDDYQRRKSYMLAYLERRAASGKVPVQYPENFDKEAYLTYRCVNFQAVSDHQSFDLGDRKAEVIFLPGHTKGSLAVFDHQSGTLLAGDNIGASLWIMFDHSAAVEEFRARLAWLYAEYPVRQVLSSHAREPYPPRIIDHLLHALDSRSEETSSVFIHPRDGYEARHHKEPVDDIPGLYTIHLVYPKPE